MGKNLKRKKFPLVTRVSGVCISVGRDSVFCKRKAFKKFPPPIAMKNFFVQGQNAPEGGSGSAFPAMAYKITPNYFLPRQELYH